MIYTYRYNNLYKTEILEETSQENFFASKAERKGDGSVRNATIIEQEAWHCLVAHNRALPYTHIVCTWRAYVRKQGNKTRNKQTNKKKRNKCPATE